MKKIYYIAIPIFALLLLLVIYFPRVSYPEYQENPEAAFDECKVIKTGNYSIVQKTYNDNMGFLNYGTAKTVKVYKKDKLVKAWSVIHPMTEPHKPQLISFWKEKAENPLYGCLYKASGREADSEGVNAPQLTFDADGRVLFWHYEEVGSPANRFRMIDGVGLLKKSKRSTEKIAGGNLCEGTEYVVAEYKNTVLGPLRTGKSKLFVADDHSVAICGENAYYLEMTDFVAETIALPLFDAEYYEKKAGTLPGKTDGKYAITDLIGNNVEVGNSVFSYQDPHVSVEDNNVIFSYVFANLSAKLYVKYLNGEYIVYKAHISGADDPDLKGAFRLFGDCLLSDCNTKLINKKKDSIFPGKSVKITEKTSENPEDKCISVSADNDICMDMIWKESKAETSAPYEIHIVSAKLEERTEDALPVSYEKSVSAASLIGKPLSKADEFFGFTSSDTYPVDSVKDGEKALYKFGETTAYVLSKPVDGIRVIYSIDIQNIELGTGCCEKIAVGDISFAKLDIMNLLRYRSLFFGSDECSTKEMAGQIIRMQAGNRGEIEVVYNRDRKVPFSFKITASDNTLH